MVEKQEFVTDDMQSILVRQHALQQTIGENKSYKCPGVCTSNPTVGEVYGYVRDNLFHLQEEITELTEEFTEKGRDIHKPWKAGHAELLEKPYQVTPKILEETMDALSFFLNIMLAVGVTPDNLRDEYAKVWEKNMNRANGNY